MLRSLFSGITGLRAHQTLMDVVSNNISNVNTTGFKSSSVVFEDTLSQVIKSAAAPTATSGGLNPAQVGLGVQVAAISTNFGQGSTQNTGKSTDLMIQGDGFFVIRNGTETDYTRAGAFKFDTNGLLETPEGGAVQGWTAKAGVVDSNATPGDITLPSGTLMAPSATTSITLAGNIKATTITSTSTAATLTLGATAYDASGAAHPLSIVLTQDLTTDPTGATWTVDVYDSTSATPTTAVSTGGPLVFNAADGTYSTGTTAVSATITAPDGSTTSTVNLDLTGLTYYGGSQSIAVTKSDGYAAGTLESLQISKDGSVVGVFSNEQKQTLAQIALANFNNPEGLEKIGDTSFRATKNSGLAQVGTAGGGGRGDLVGGALEMSNVDLAQEFTNLIIAQRGFQANTRVITTSDQMLQDLVDLKR